MSALALSPGAGPADIAARIAQIQTMQAQLAGGPSAASTASPATTMTSSPATGTFAAALASAQGTSGAATGSNAYAPQIQAAATKYGIDPNLLTALVKQESGFNPNARSGAGAVGLTQLMPATAAAMGVTDPTDPAQALDGGARYLKEQLDRFGGDPAKALAAYNAGPGAVQKFGGVPPYAETQNYVKTILANASGGSVS